MKRLCLVFLFLFVLVSCAPVGTPTLLPATVVPTAVTQATPSEPTAVPVEPTATPDEPTAAPPEPTATPGESLAPPDVQELLLQPGDRRYTIAIPANYTGERPVPLVLSLHFGGTVTAFYGKVLLNMTVEPALRELGAIIVAPDCNGDGWTDPQSEADVIDLLDHVYETYNIDPQRTLVTGYSMGGRGTWHMAARYPERFTAAVVMAGAPPTDALDIEWQVPIYAIHSRDDTVILFERTEPIVTQLQEQGVPVEFVVLEEVGHYDMAIFVELLQEAIPWIEQAWQ